MNQTLDDFILTLGSIYNNIRTIFLKKLERGDCLALADVLNRKLKELSAYRTQVEEFKNLSQKEYRESWKIQRVVDRTLQLCIECCLDMANHIISEKAFREPNSNADIFSILEENQYYNSDLSRRLQQMAQFQNILIHEYATVNPDNVIHILRENLPDFDLFAQSIIKKIEVY